MTPSIETKIKSVVTLMETMGSGIQEGKSIDLFPLEDMVNELYLMISRDPLQEPVKTRSMIDKKLNLIMNDLNYLEELVVASNEGHEPPSRPHNAISQHVK